MTLQIEERAAARFTALRKTHFPADRNWLSAHITLFHALPVSSLDQVLSDAAALASATKEFDLQIDRVLFLGRGVAYGIASVEGLQLRRSLEERWRPLLSRQDAAWQGRLHITVQNKVAPATAKALHAELTQGFVPEHIGATGIEVWHYVGGPWRHAATFEFASSNSSE